MASVSMKEIPPATLKLMSEIVSYPVLLEHEESLTKTNQESIMYDVLSWMIYLSQIDDILLSFQDAITASSQQKRNKGNFSTTTIGGRSINVQELGKFHHLLHNARNLVSERALALLPGSYKLWYDYLSFRSKVYIPPTYLIRSSAQCTRYKSTISAYERSLVRMNKYPRIWLSYISFVIHNDPCCSVTNIRRLFNRALLALPATQHELIWSEYLTFILNEAPPKGLFIVNGKEKGPVLLSIQNGTMEQQDCPWDIPHETILRVLRRYAHYYNPAARELLANVALEHGRYGEAASVYCEVLNDTDFLSANGTTRHELWIQFTDVCTEHPEETRNSGVAFEGIVRGVLKPEENGGHKWKVFDETRRGDEEGGKDELNRQEKIKEQQAQLQASLGELEGTLWNKLALYHIRSGEFELARSIYEEAMESVSRVRDFSLIFDAYVKFEENVIEVLMERMNEEEEDNDAETANHQHEAIDDEDLDILLGKTSAKPSADEDEENLNADIELALVRAENLMNRRPLLLNYVLLQQNPQNIAEWLKRSELYLKSNQPSQSIASLEEAVKKVSSWQAMNGSPADLYKALASLYEKEMTDIKKARSVFERVCVPKPEYRFRDADDLAQCYAEWVELELRVENWDQALSVARRSIARPPSGTAKVVRGLVRSMRLWNLLLDLEESLGTLQTTKDAYNRLLELKVATPTQVLNFAKYLSEKKYFEESFTAFERGLDMFPFPHPGGNVLWKEYLQAFEARYEGTKIHRMRELFDRCLDSCPAECSCEFFLVYGKFEEQFGLTKRALGVYERMCTIVPAEEKYSAYQLYIAKTVKYIGITATRTIYERAIPALEDKPAAKMCVIYAKMEASLHEIDRARAAYTFGAQLADPRTNPEYWGEWHEFEVAHGNEETFREMLRIKRGVQTAFSTVNYNTADTDISSKADAPLSHEDAIAMLAAQEGEGLEGIENERISGFVKAKRPAEVKDLDEVERRAAKLRKVTASLVASTQARVNDNDEEIDIDD
jgi:pre-mRNA-splicing factor SYF1|eukprot:scaffold3131_cov247-Chaetoceros_neogracile.AAC.2